MLVTRWLHDLAARLLGQEGRLFRKTRNRRRGPTRAQQAIARLASGHLDFASPEFLVAERLEDRAVPSIVSIAAAFNANETGMASGQFTVSLDAASVGDTTVNYMVGGTATAGSDYSALSGSVTITNGNMSAPIDVMGISDDALVEGNQTVIVTLQSADNGGMIDMAPNNTATIQISDNDCALLTLEIGASGSGITFQSLSEGGTDGTIGFTITSSAMVEGGFTVNLSETGVTTESNDYMLPATVVFGDSQLTNTFNLTTVGDLRVETTETIVIEMSTTPVQPGAIVTPSNTASVALMNDDSATLTLSPALANVTEGNMGSTTTMFTLTLDAEVEGGLTVEYFTEDGFPPDAATDGDTMPEDTDYLAIAPGTTLNMTGAAGAGGAQTFTVSVFGDVDGENDENFQVRIGNLLGTVDTDSFINKCGSPAAVTIVDDDSITITATDPTATEAGTTTATFTVALPSGMAPADITVDFALDLINQTATTDGVTADFTLSGGTGFTFDPMTGIGSVVIPMGGSSTTITLTPNNDTTVELTEDVIIALTGADNSYNVDTAPVSAYIASDDTASLSIIDQMVSENGTFSFNVFSSNAADRDVTVVLNTADVTATGGTDYATLTNVTVTILAGATMPASPTMITLTNDRRLEGPESFAVNLTDARYDNMTDASLVTIGDPSAAMTITDNESATFQFASGSSSVNEDNVTHSLPVTLVITPDGAGAGVIGLDRNVSVNVSNPGTGTATAADFTFTSPQTLTFMSGSNGSTLTLDATPAILEDILNDPAETIDLTVAINTDGTGIVMNGTQLTHTVTINDDDSATGGTYNAPSGNGADTLSVRLDAGGTVLEIYSGMTLVASRNFATLTSLVIQGADNETDQLTVDFINGNPIPSSGLTFNGGSAGNDKLIINGGTFATATFNHTNANDGSVVLAGSTVNYTGLEPVDTTGTTITSLVINLPDTDDATDDNTQLSISGGNLIVDSTNGEHEDDTIALAGITSITVNGRAGDDTITLLATMSGFTGAITIDGGNQSDIINLDAALSLAGTSGLSVTGDTINVTQNQTTAGGTVSLTGSTVIGVNGLTINTDGAADGAVTFSGSVNADDSSTQNRSLTVTAGTATVQFGGAVGTGANGALSDLDVTGGLIRLGGSVTVDDGAGSATATLTGPVQLDADISIDIDGAFDNNVSFTSTVAGSTNGSQSLAITAGTATVSFGGAVGTAAIGLEALSVTTSGQTTLSGNIFTDTAGGTGNVSFSSGGNVVLSTGITIDTEQFNDGSAGTVNFGTSAVSASAMNVDLTVNTVTTNGASNSGAATLATFNSTGGNAIRHLTVNAAHATPLQAGNLTLTNAVGIGGNLDLDGRTISLSTGNSDVTITGTNTVSIDASRNISLATGSSISVVNGNMTLNANTAGTATGAFRGIQLNGATLTTSGTGNISLTGIGGDSGSLNRGIDIGSVSVIQSTSAVVMATQGTITINGTGGSAGGNQNQGVNLETAGTRINSIKGDIQITGTGGTGSSFDYGVRIGDESVVESTDTAKITITGTTAATGSFEFGINIQDTNTKITSKDGDIQITGTGGLGPNDNNRGISIESAATVESTGAAQITLIGSGRGSGVSTNNDGVNIQNASTTVVSTATGTGNIIIIGTHGVGANSAGIQLLSDNSIQSLGTANVTLIGDRMEFSGGTTAINAPGRTVTLRQANAADLAGEDNGDAINLGSAVDTTANTLELSDTELDRVSAGTLNIGNATTSTITVSADITRPGTTIVNLTNGSTAAINFTTGALNSNGGNVVLTPGTGGVGVAKTGNDVAPGAAGTLSFAAGSDLNINIAGATVDTQYNQLDVAGMVNLTGVDLVLSGAFVPATTDSFVLVDNDGADAVVGEFNGKPEGFLQTFIGVTFYLTYVGGTGNDVVLAPVSVSVTVTPAAGVAEGTAADGATPLTYTFTRSGPNTTMLVTTFAVSGTATVGTDYTLTGATSFNSMTMTGTVTFAAMSSMTSFTVNPLRDVGGILVERDETVIATVTSDMFDTLADGYYVAGAPNNAATGTIRNDDLALLSVNNVTVNEEAGTLTFMVSINQTTVGVTPTVVTAAENITFNYSTLDDPSPPGGQNAATVGADYTANSGTATITAGMTSTTINVAITNENLVELTETFLLNINNALFGLDLLPNGTLVITDAGATLPPTGGVTYEGAVVFTPADPQGRATITNTDSTQFSFFGNVSQSEASGSLVFTVLLSAPVDAITSVNVSTSDGTAQDDNPVSEDNDYTPLVNQTVTFNSGETSRTFSVAITSDNVVELNETFTATLVGGSVVDAGRTVPGPMSAVTIGAPSSATGTISNDDTAVFTVNSVAGNENGGAMTFTVTLSNPVDADTSVNVSTADGTAQDGGGGEDTDYTAISGQMLTFMAGTFTRTFTVSPTPDTKVELTETFAVSLSGVVNNGRSVTASPAAGTGTITNDDSAVLSFTTPVVSAFEDSAIMTFTVSLTDPLGAPVTVDVPVSVGINTANGTATLADNDYSAGTQTLIFNQGEGTKTFDVSVTADNKVELDETLLAELTAGSVNASGRAVTISLAAGAKTGTITNDDMAQFTIGNASVSEDSGYLTFTISLDKPVDVATNVKITTVDQTAKVADGDYTPLTNFLVSFAAGATSRVFQVAPVIDSGLEADETLTFTLSEISSSGRAVTANPAQGTGTILNDDASTSGLDGLGRLVLAQPDLAGAGRADKLTVTFDSATNELVINDPDNTLSAVTGLGTVSTDMHTVRILVASIPNRSLVVALGGMNDKFDMSTVPTTVLTSASVLGGSGNDTITTSSGNDTLEGGDGQDSLNGSNGDDVLIGSTAADAATAGNDNDVLLGGAGHDRLIDDLGNDTLRGHQGNDTMTGGVGNDLLDAGGFDDDLLIETNTAAGTITMNSTVMSGPAASLGTNRLSSFERASITGSSMNDLINATSFGAKVTLIGGEGNDSLYGGAKDDVLLGGNGNDSLLGRAGNDSLVGGDDDNATLVSTDGSDFLNGEAGNDTITGGKGNDSGLGGAGNDLMSGGSGNDTLNGQANNDTIDGGADSDSLLGDANADSLIGGAGNDIARGGNDKDTITGGDDSDSLFGDAGDDNLDGGAANDSLSGGAGDDSLSGAAGNDTLVGDAGNDTLTGGDDNDGLVGGDGNDSLSGDAGNDTAIGGNGNDTIFGGAGNDTLAGQAGSDTVQGDADTDRIAGGSGTGVNAGDLVTDLLAEIDEAFSVSFNSLTGTFTIV